MTNAVNLASAAGTGFFRNKLINGGFDVWQRGTSFSATTPVFTADRWFVTHAGSALTANYTRQDAAGVWGQAKYFIRLARTSGAGMTLHNFTQRIEGVETLQDGKATVSFDCRDLTAAQTINVRLVQNFGVGGSADVSIASQPVAVPTGSTPQRRSVTFDIPSIAGKTIGTSNYLALIIDLPLSGSFQIDLANVQLEVGSVSTPFERRPYSLEELMCQRFYWHASPPRGVAVGSNAMVQRAKIPTPVTMRAVPTLTLLGSIPCWNGSSAFVITSFVTQYSSVNCLEFDANLSGSFGTHGQCISFYNNYDGTGFAANAEL